jgi:hypothetical protein
VRVRAHVGRSGHMGRQIYGSHMVEEDERPNHAPPHERQHATDVEAAEILAPITRSSIRPSTPRRKPQPGRMVGPQEG